MFYRSLTVTALKIRFSLADDAGKSAGAADESVRATSDPGQFKRT
jgi:hypothetical protein